MKSLKLIELIKVPSEYYSQEGILSDYQRGHNDAIHSVESRNSSRVITAQEIESVFLDWLSSAGESRLTPDEVFELSQDILSYLQGLGEK